MQQDLAGRRMWLDAAMGTNNTTHSGVLVRVGRGSNSAVSLYRVDRRFLF